MPQKDRLKVLLLTRNFPPMVGGMERLNYHMLQELGREYEVAVAGPAGCREHLPNLLVEEFAIKPKARFVIGSMRSALKLGLRQRPDVILCGSGATALAGRLLAAVLRRPMITYVHGLDLTTRHPLYRALFLPAIRLSTKVIANSRNTASLAAGIGVARDRLSILHPGVHIEATAGVPSALPSTTARDACAPVLLSVGRLTERKGLLEFIARCMPALIERHPSIRLRIIGEDAHDAISGNSGMRGKLEGLIAHLGLQQHVELLGSVSEEHLSQAYRRSDLLIFPTLELPGDVEGFGMVAVEAAAHGLPTIGFRVGGVPDAVKEGVSGYLVDAGRYDLLAEKISALLRHELSLDQTACLGFAKEFGWPAFGERLRALVRAAASNRAD